MESQLHHFHVNVPIYRMGRSQAPLGGGLNEIILARGGVAWMGTQGWGRGYVVHKQSSGFLLCFYSLLLITIFTFWGVPKSTRAERDCYERLHEV